jgi:hypothetical protein
VVWSIIVVLRGVTSSGPSGARLIPCAESGVVESGADWARTSSDGTK